MEIECGYKVDFVDGWQPEALRECLAGARRVVMTAHTNADGDAVGSLTGMYALLRRVTELLSNQVTESSIHSVTQPLGHLVTITPMLPDGCPEDLAWLPHTDLILSGKSDLERCQQAIAEADLIICMDLNNLDRTGVLADALRASKAKRILFDHHIGPDRENFDLVVSDPDISSTCELIYWAFRKTYGHKVFDEDSATSLFTGLCTDTGTFSYSNHRQSVYLAAAELSQMGIDPKDINHKIKNVFTEARLRFFGYAMSELLTVYSEHDTALMVIHKEDMQRFGVESADLTGLVNEVMKLRDIDCAILVREEDNKVRLSLRSKYITDVNQMANELFGGGGHTRAAGATSTLSLAETVKKVKKHLGLLVTLLLFTFHFPLFTSCNDVPVIEVPQAKISSEPDLIKTNQMIAQRENTEIENFAARRNWKMSDIGSGIKVMKTREGKGSVADYNDTVAIRYTVRNIEDKVVYDNVEDTVVIGRLQPNRGIDFALRTLNEGSRAWVILPSEEAYGVPGDGNRIGKRWVLIYDLEINKIDKQK